jgi:GT2 family glycosyltransferase
VLITDDDCLVDAECVGQIVTVFESDPRANCVTGAVQPHGDTHKKVGVAITNTREHREWQGLGRPWGIGHSVNLTFRRTTYEAVGGFDEDMGPGTALYAAEDLDVLYRVLRSGGKIVYEPGAIIFHDQWRSRLEARQRRRDYARGTAAFLLKHILIHRDTYALRLLPARLWEDVPLLAMIGLAKHNLELELVSMYQLWGLVVGFWVAGWHYGRQLRAGRAQP